MTNQTDSNQEIVNEIDNPLPTEDLIEVGEDTDEPVLIPEPELSFSTFAEANLDPQLLAGINSLGWKNPTKIQSLCLPHTLEGKDLAGFAQTGTGKTGVFLISVAQRVLGLRAKGVVQQPLAIVLSPTRELAMQIEADAQALFSLLDIKSLAVFGGVDYEKQAKHLKDGVDVIVATPGRLKDFSQKKIFNIENCAMFICDEADRMFDMGFIDDVKFFLDKLPENSQRLLFSATTNEKVGELAFEYLNKPIYISATPESITPEAINQRAIICDSTNKLKVMIGLLRQDNPACAIVFTNTKLTAEWLHFKLNHNGFETDLITGDLPQRKRINLIKKIKDGEIKALIATDVASRGLHIAGVTNVYNFDLPDDPSNYVHRIGRTARGGARGNATSLVCEDYGANLKAINELLGESLALKAEWYDSEFDNITDLAGNPFVHLKGNKSRGNDNRRGDSSRSGRRPGASGGNRGGRSNAQSASSPKRDSNVQGSNQRNHRNNERRNDQQRRDQRRNAAHSDRPQSSRHAGDRDHRHKPRKFDQRTPAPASKTQVDLATPSSFTGIVKKIFATFFSKKKKPK